MFYFLLVDGENRECTDERILWWCLPTPVYTWWGQLPGMAATSVCVPRVNHSHSLPLWETLQGKQSLLKFGLSLSRPKTILGSICVEFWDKRRNTEVLLQWSASRLGPQKRELTLSSRRLKLALYQNASQWQSTNSRAEVTQPQDSNVSTGRILLMFCNPERQNCLFCTVQVSLSAGKKTGWILGKSSSWARCSHALEVPTWMPRTDVFTAEF